MRHGIFSSEWLVRSNRLQYEWPKHDMLPAGEGLCLDDGCGYCTSAPMIEALGYNWIGVDIERKKKAPLSVLGDATCLPFRSETFEAVYMEAVLEHLTRPWGAFREAHRVLKPGGFLAGSAAFLEPFHQSYFHFTHWGIEHLLKDSGFRVVTIEPGASMFLTLTRFLIGTGRKRMAFFLAKYVFRPAVLLLTALDMIQRKVRGWRGKGVGEVPFSARAPLTYAGHIRWLATKSEV